MKSLAIQLMSVALALSVLACGSKSPTDPSSSGSGSSSSGSSGGGGSNPAPGSSTGCTAPGTAATGSMSATINGTTWRALCVGVTTSVAGIISIAGGEAVTATTGTTIGFATNRSVGTTNIGVLSATNALLTVGGGALWQAALSNGSGTVTISTLTANSASGTFSFTMTAQANTTATGTKTVTNGVFNVNF
jgi:uncharacterized protein DUF6252